MGKCIYQAHKNNPAIREAIAIKGCPPKPEDMLKALHKAGIDADPGLFENIDHLPGFYMERYQDKPEFDEGFFRVS
jgi:coenzyme F420-reducing hydrogenase gamma subunit